MSRKSDKRISKTYKNSAIIVQRETIIQFIKFGIVGLSNTVLSYVLYLFFLYIFQRHNIFEKNDYIVSSVITFFICTIWAFIWNNCFTFRKRKGEKRNMLKAFLRTFLCYSITGLGVQNIMLFLLVNYAKIPKQFSPIVVLFVTVPLNFLMNKYWAFRSDK